MMVGKAQKTGVISINREYLLKCYDIDFDS